MTYSAEVLDHFRHPRHPGELENASAVAEASNPVCGDMVKLWVRVEQGRVTAARFKAAGCVPAIACASWLAARISGGLSVDEARSITAAEIERGLGGLPAASAHAALLAMEALHRALQLLTQ